MVSEKGYVSLQILVLLLILSAFALGFAALFFSGQAPLEQIKNFSQAQSLLEILAEEVRILEKQDLSPEASSQFDPLGKLSGQIRQGWSIGLEDVSSKLNLNWINTDLIANTALKKCLIPSKNLQEFKQFRADQGFARNLDHYKDFIKEEYLDSWFTVNSFANINISYEYSLEQLFQYLTQNKADAKNFHREITVHLESKHLWTQEELLKALGIYKDEVYPVINTLPSMNVNWIPEELLREILAYPFPEGSIKNASLIADELLSRRSYKELNKQDLQELITLSTEQAQRVFEYLGVKTQVYCLSISQKGQKFSRFIASQTF